MLRGLLGIYLFLVPFEHVLEYYFGIDTVFKPYRIIAMIFLTVAAIFAGRKIKVNDGNDGFLLATFAIGLLISLVRWKIGYFNANLFLNFLTQSVLYLLVYLFAKAIPWRVKDSFSFFGWLAAGIILNDIFAFQQFFSFGLIGTTRVYGLMDNPNFFALSNCYLFGLGLATNGRFPGLFRYLRFPVLLFGVAGILLSGSRASVLIGVISLATYALLITDFRQKVRLTGVGVSVVLLAILVPSTRNLIVNTPAFWRSTDVSASGGFKEDIRLTLWRAGMNAGVDTYFLGLGQSQFLAYGNFERYMRDVDPILAGKGWGLGLHNDYLSILVENGFVAFACYLVFLFRLLLRHGMSILYSSAGERNPFSTLQLLLIITLLLFGLFSVTSLSPIYWALLFLTSLSASPTLSPTEKVGHSASVQPTPRLT